jgi:hypothetical protein
MRKEAGGGREDDYRADQSAVYIRNLQYCYGIDAREEECAVQLQTEVWWTYGSHWQDMYSLRVRAHHDRRGSQHWHFTQAAHKTSHSKFALGCIVSKTGRRPDAKKC